MESVNKYPALSFHRVTKILIVLAVAEVFGTKFEKII
jgi:hypothetical protein